MNKDLHTGDVVRLISGGPLMTFEKYSDSHGCSCVWFDGNLRQSAYFVREMLICYVT